MELKIQEIVLGVKTILRDDLSRLEAFLWEIESKLMEHVARVPATITSDKGLPCRAASDAASFCLDHYPLRGPKLNSVEDLLKTMMPSAGLDEKSIPHHRDSLIAYNTWARTAIASWIDKVRIY